MKEILNRRRMTTDVPDSVDTALEIATDAELVARFARRREKAAFAELVEKHSQMVAHVCQQVLGRGADADDAFQATFLILARRSSAIRKASSVAAWLHGVAYRTAVRMARRRSSRPLQPLGDFAGEADGVLSLIHRREIQRIVHDELEAMPMKYRDVLVLHYLEGRSRIRIAEELECTESAVKGKLARGRKQLRIRLARRGVGLSIAAAAVAASTAHASAELCSSAVGAALGLRTESGAPAALTRPHQLAQEGVHAMMFTSVSKFGGVVGVVVAIASIAMLDPAGWRTRAQELPASSALNLAADADPAEGDVSSAAQAVGTAEIAGTRSAANPPASVAATAASPSALDPAAESSNGGFISLVESPPSAAAPQWLRSPPASREWRLMEADLAVFEAEFKFERSKALERQADAKEIEAEAHRQQDEGKKSELLAKARSLHAHAEAQLLRVSARYEARQAEVFTRRAELLREWAEAAPTAMAMGGQRQQQTEQQAASTPQQPPEAIGATLPVTISPGDVIVIRVAGVFPEQPIGRLHQVERSGNVSLGPAYGRARVAGMTIEEAEEAIKKQLAKTVKSPEVQVTWPIRGVDVQQPEAIAEARDRPQPVGALPPDTISPGDVVRIEVFGFGSDVNDLFRVERSGQVALGARFGRAKIAGMTLAEAEQEIGKHLAKLEIIGGEITVQVTWPVDRTHTKVAPAGRN